MAHKTNGNKKAKLKHSLRRLVQISSIVFFFYLLVRTQYPLTEKLPLNIYFRADALLGISSSLATTHCSFYFFPALVMLALVILLGNFFCFWICPLGGLVDIGNSILCRGKWKFRIKTPSWLRKVRLFILTGILVVSLLGGFFKIPYFVWIFDPFVILTRALVVKGSWLIFFLILLLASFLIPRLWCNNLCPLGALYYLLGTRMRNAIRRKRSKNSEAKP